MKKRKTIIFICNLVCIIFMVFAVTNVVKKKEVEINECVQWILRENNVKESTILELADYRKVRYDQVEVGNVTEEELDEMIDMELSNYSEFKKVNKKNVETGDFIYVDYTVYCEGEMINQVHDEIVHVGTGDFDKAFEDAVIGAEIGKELLVELVIPDDNSGNQWIGKKAEFHIDVISINEYVTCKVTDEFVKNNYGKEGLNTTQDFYQWMEKICRQNKEDEIFIQNKNNIVDKLLHDSKFNMSEEEVGKYALDIYTNYEQISYMYGYDNVEEYYEKELNLSDEQFYNMCYEEGEREIKEYLLLGAIAEKEKIAITDKDIEIYCNENGEDYKKDMTEKEKNNYIYNILQNRVYNIFLEKNEK